MNLGHLAIFRAVADAGNVSRAADKLMISQPAVSKQLRLLEQALGSTLFQRLPKGMRLTPAGDLLAGYAARLFALEAEAERAVKDFNDLRRGELVIGASNTIGVYLLPDVLVRFCRTYPEVRVRLEIAHSEVIARWFRRGEIEVGLVESKIDADDLVAEPFARPRLVAIAAKGQPITRRRKIRLAALCRERFVVREAGSGTKSLLERALADRGLTLTPAMSLGSSEAVKRAVAAGEGVAIVSEITVATELAAGTLARLDVAALNLVRPLYRLKTKGGYESPAAKAFWPMLREAVKENGLD